MAAEERKIVRRGTRNGTSSPGDCNPEVRCKYDSVTPRIGNRYGLAVEQCNDRPTGNEPYRENATAEKRRIFTIAASYAAPNHGASVAKLTICRW